MKKTKFLVPVPTKHVAPLFLAVSALVLSACSQQPNSGYGMYGNNTMVPQNDPRFFNQGIQPQYYPQNQPPVMVQNQPQAEMPEYQDPRTPLERIRDMSGGEDLYNGTVRTSREGVTSPEAVNELIRSVERDLKVGESRSASTGRSSTATGTSSGSSAVDSTITSAENSVKTGTSAADQPACANGVCPIRPQGAKESAAVSVSADSEEKVVHTETKTEETRGSEASHLTEKSKNPTEPPFDLNILAYSNYFRDMMPHYASENLTGLKIDTLTYRHVLNAGLIYETFRTEHPGMAECQQVKNNKALIQLQQTYSVLKQKEKEEEQALSAQIEKARKKVGKIKDLTKREKAFQKELDAIWKKFNNQKLVDYYQGIGVQQDQILMNATPDLNSFIDSIESCIQDAKKDLGIPS